jgi:hypothetical protein
MPFVWNTTGTNCNIAAAGNTFQTKTTIASGSNYTSGNFYEGAANTFNDAALAQVFHTTPSIELTDNTSAAGPDLSLTRISNAAANSDNLGRILFYGRDTSNVSRVFAYMRVQILNASNATPTGMFQFLGLNNGVDTLMGYFGPGLVVGAPTGGQKGFGTINANAVYDDNVLLTCYVLDLFLNGTIDLDAWDKRANGKHTPARDFACYRTAELDPKVYAKGGSLLDICQDFLLRKNGPKVLRQSANWLKNCGKQLNYKQFTLTHWKNV